MIFTYAGEEEFVTQRHFATMEDSSDVGIHQRRANAVRGATVSQLDSLIAGGVEGSLAVALVVATKGGRALRFVRHGVAQLLGKDISRVTLAELKDVKVELTKGDDGEVVEVRFGALNPGTDEEGFC